MDGINGEQELIWNLIVDISFLKFLFFLECQKSGERKLPFQTQLIYQKNVCNAAPKTRRRNKK
jgi:hypothetical protein